MEEEEQHAKELAYLKEIQSQALGLHRSLLDFNKKILRHESSHKYAFAEVAADHVKSTEGTFDLAVKIAQYAHLEIKNFEQTKNMTRQEKGNYFIERAMSVFFNDN
jgi:hypothetical protein